MMNIFRNVPKLIALVTIAMLCLTNCKSKKKAMEASNAAKEKAKMEQEAALRQQQEEQRKREEEERARREQELRNQEKAKNEVTPKIKLNQYFMAISSAATVDAANKSINEALTMFASPDTPVLIVISESGGQKDYDRPTTIKEYLNYLKDQKKNINAISTLKTDASGKITEVELRKNN